MIDNDTRIVVQGITGEQGAFHAERMVDYGTNVVAGVTPGKAGETVHGVPVYDSVEGAKAEHGGDWSIGFVPPTFAKDAAMEALENGLNTCIITEHVPVHDAVDIMQAAKRKGLWVVGPNCPGLIAPGKSKMGIMPGEIFAEGRVGVISRSGTLTYEIVDQLTGAGLGQSLAVGIGGDPVIGMDFRDLLPVMDDDPDTDVIVTIGEIGGDLEERAADMIAERIETPVVAYIAGRTAPKGTQMGHAGAIVYEGRGTAESKITAFTDAGVAVAELPSQVPDLIERVR